MSGSNRYWAVVPAAGVGKRMRQSGPKQYLQLNGKPLIEWSLSRLLEVNELQRLVVVVSAKDKYWPGLRMAANRRIQTVFGGAQRCHSVLNGLDALADSAADDDWVLVHDAARPCVRAADIRRLIRAVTQAGKGGILAVPITDTVKRAGDKSEIEDTVDRRMLWRALTPQCFRYAELRAALRLAVDRQWRITDEAAAMERAGQRPLLVEGASDNIKVTAPEDLALAGFFIANQSGDSA